VADVQETTDGDSWQGLREQVEQEELPLWLCCQVSDDFPRNEQFSCRDCQQRHGEEYCDDEDAHVKGRNLFVLSCLHVVFIAKTASGERTSEKMSLSLQQ